MGKDKTTYEWFTCVSIRTHDCPGSMTLVFHCLIQFDKNLKSRELVWKMINNEHGNNPQLN